MKRKLTRFFLGFLLIFPRFAAADVNVAVIAPLAGEYKRFGSELVNGVRVAVDEINDQGGLNGEKINLITVDDQCDDRLAISTAQMMAVNSSRKDKMNLVIGPYCSNAFNQVADVYAKAGIFQIIPTTISARSAGRSHKGLVKMMGFDERQGLDFYNYYMDNFSGINVALVYDSRLPDGMDIVKVIEQEFINGGEGNRYFSYDFARYHGDFERMYKDMRKKNAEMAYILGKPKSVAKLSKAIKEEDDKFIIFTNRYQSQESYEKIMGDLAEGSYVVGLPSLKNNPAFTETLVKLRLLGIEPEGLSVYSYSAVKLWEDLVDKTDSFSYDKLASALNRRKVDTAWGETMFTNGNPDNPVNYSIYQIRSGEYTQVY